MTRNGEQQVIVAWRKIGKLVHEELRYLASCRRIFRALCRDSLLNRRWNKIVWLITKPGFQKGADGIDIIKVIDVKEVHVEFFVDKIG